MLCMPDEEVIYIIYPNVKQYFEKKCNFLSRHRSPTYKSFIRVY